jgi:hypothetical protein
MYCCIVMTTHQADVCAGWMAYTHDVRAGQRLGVHPVTYGLDTSAPGGSQGFNLVHCGIQKTVCDKLEGQTTPHPLVWSKGLGGKSAAA